MDQPIRNEFAMAIRALEMTRVVFGKGQILCQSSCQSRGPQRRLAPAVGLPCGVGTIAAFRSPSRVEIDCCIVRGNVQSPQRDQRPVGYPRSFQCETRSRGQFAAAARDLSRPARAERPQKNRWRARARQAGSP